MKKYYYHDSDMTPKGGGNLPQSPEVIGVSDPNYGIYGKSPTHMKKQLEEAIIKLSKFIGSDTLNEDEKKPLLEIMGLLQGLLIIESIK